MREKSLHQTERWLKSCLKRKISISERTLIAFLIAGTFGFVGENLFADIPNSNNNIFVGQGAGGDNQGNHSIAIGKEAGQATTENYNIAIGEAAGFKANWWGNTFNGKTYKIESTDPNNPMGYNFSFGKRAGNHVGGRFNQSIGYYAGNEVIGEYNYTNGQLSGFQTYGDYNFAFGKEAGRKVTGDYNFAFGFQAGQDLGKFKDENGTEVGGNNISLMQGAGNQTKGSFNMAVGFQAGEQTKGHYNFALGPQAGKKVTGDENIAMGSHAGQNVTGRVNYALGLNAGQNVAGNGNYAIGENAGQNVKGAANTDSDTKGWSNFAIGKGAGNNIIGNHNYSLGENAGKYVGYRVAWENGVFKDSASPYEYIRPSETNKNKESGAEHNIALGANSGSYIAGQDNVALGQGAGSYIDGANSGGAANTAIGKGAGNKVYGDENISMGSSAGNDINGHQNIALGVSSASKIKGNKNIAIGVNSSNTTANFIEKTDSISLGTEADATKNNAIAIGKGAKADGKDSISIGTGNVVSGNKSGAIGDPSYVSGEGTYTIGNDNGTEVDKIAANNAGAFGNSNKMTAAAEGSRIVGNSNTVSVADAFVLGNSVTANVANSVYLGNESAAITGDKTAGTTEYKTVTITAPEETGRVARTITLGEFAGHTPVGVVTVGAAGKERRIQNVAAGKISATSTDAVNGSQLYALASKMTDIVAAAANTIEYFSVNSTNGTNKDNKGAVGADSIAIGKNAKSSAENSVSIGLNAKSLGGNSVTLGIDAQTYYYAVAIGDKAKSGHWSIALGQKSEALPSQSISIGMEAKIKETANNKSAVSIAIGNETQINDSAQSLALGASAKIENSENSIALGTKSTIINGGNSVAIGASSSAKSVEAIAIGIRSVIDKNASSSIALGRDSYVGEIKEKNENLPNTGQPDINIGDYVEEKVMNPLDKNKYYYSMALGADSRAYGYQNTALGAGAEAYNTNSLAVGMATTSKGDFSSAIGRQAYTDGKYATALGYLSKSIEESALALGDKAIADKKEGIALGSNSKTDTSKQFGYDPSGNFTNLDTLLKDNKTEYDSKNQEISALEREVSELSNQYIALLNEKNTANAERIKEIDAELATKETELSAKKSELKTKKSELNKMISVWNATSEGLSIGNSELGLTRQINNVAAGTEDTDAVNVAQLKGVTLRVTGDNYDANVEAAADVNKNKENIGKVKLSEQDLAINGTSDLITTTVAKDGQAVTISIADKFIEKVNGKADKSDIDTTTLTITDGKVADITADSDKTKFVTAETIKTAINDTGFYINSAAAGGTNTGAAKTLVKAGEEVKFKAGKNVTINQNEKEFTFSVELPETKAIEYFSVNSTANGNKDNSGATGLNAIAIGPSSTATKKNALAIGDIANAGEYAVALGTETNADGKGAVALGNRIVASGENSTAIGVQVTATGLQAISIGGLSKAEGKDSIAIGSSSHARKLNSIAIGASSDANKLNSIAIGFNSKSLNNNSIVLGNKSIAFGANNITIGNSSVTNNLDSTAVGNDTFTIGTFSTALGSHSSALSDSAIGIGNEASAAANKSVSIGYKSSAEGMYSISFGSDSLAKSDNSVAIGNFAKSNKISGVALGANSVVNTDAGILGYDHFSGKITSTSDIQGLSDEDKQKIPQLETTVLELKSDYESKVNTYLKRLNTLNSELREAILKKNKDKIDELTDEKENLELDLDEARENYLSNTSVIEYNKLVGAWKSSLGAVSVGDSEKGLTRQITNLAAGTEDTDAVNVAQLKGVTLRVTGDNLATAADAIGKVKLSEQDLAINGTDGEITTSVTKDGQAVTISLADDIKNSINSITNKADKSEIKTYVVEAGNNVVVTPDDTTTPGTVKFTVDLAKDINLTDNGSLTIGNTTVNKDGLKIANGPSVTSSGIDAGKEVIRNVKDGEISETSTEAINGSQLYKVAKALKNDVTTAIGEIKPVEVLAGTNVAVTPGKKPEDDKVITYTINAEKTTLSSANDDFITVVAGEKDNNTNITNYTIDLAKKTKDRIDVIERDSKVRETVVKGSSNNLTVVTAEKENTTGGKEFIVDLAKDINLTNDGSLTIGNTAVNNDGLIINGNGPSVTSSGINAGNKVIKNVEDGENDTDAVNVRQLKTLSQSVQNYGDIINNNSQRIDTLNSKVNSGLANASAMSALEFQEIGINQAVVAAGVGTFNGSQAVAVGMQTAPTENVRVNVKASVSPRTKNGINTMAAIGASYKFNWK